MDATAITLRFMFGVVLAGSVAVFIGLPLIATFISVLAVGVIAAIWGDKFFMGFASVMKYFR